MYYCVCFNSWSFCNFVRLESCRLWMCDSPSSNVRSLVPDGEWRWFWDLLAKRLLVCGIPVIVDVFEASIGDLKSCEALISFCVSIYDIWFVPWPYSILISFYSLGLRALLSSFFYFLRSLFFGYNDFFYFWSLGLFGIKPQHDVYIYFKIFIKLLKMLNRVFNNKRK